MRATARLRSRELLRAPLSNRVRSCILALITLVTMVGASAPARALDSTILIFGDSLSAGYGLASAEGWASLLEARLREGKLPWRVVNASVSGETSAGGATRIDAALHDHQPAIVIIELGANDGLRGLPVAQMQANLARIIDASQRMRSRVVLIGMQMPPNYGARYTQAFAASYADLAARSRVALVPFMFARFANRRELMQADGLHPTREAQPLILDTVWPILRPLL